MRNHRATLVLAEASAQRETDGTLVHVFFH
jgi:hypothetical protein